MRLLVFVTLILCNTQAFAISSALTVAWSALTATPLQTLAQYTELGFGFWQRAFVIKTRARAVDEFFQGVDEVKQCLQPESSWRRKDRSGCVAGPVRVVAAGVLWISEPELWFGGRFVERVEPKNIVGWKKGARKMLGWKKT